LGVQAPSAAVVAALTTATERGEPEIGDSGIWRGGFNKILFDEKNPLKVSVVKVSCLNTA